jgi:hypothetical protein
VEDSLTAVGVAAFGQPLLDGVTLVLQRYLARKDLATGCGPLRRMGAATIDKCGTVTDGEKYNFRHYREPQPMHAEARLFLREGTKDFLAAQHLGLHLWGGDGDTLCAYLALTGPTKRTSSMHRNDAAALQILPGHPTDPPAQPCDGLGAMFILACQAAEGAMCAEGAETTQQALRAYPAVAVPRADLLRPAASANGNPGQPEEFPGNPLHPPEANPGNPLPAPEATLGNPLQLPEANPGNPLQAPEASPVNPMQPLQANRGNAEVCAPVPIRPRGGRAATVVRRVSWAAHPVDHEHASQTVVDLATATAMKMAAALQLPCCGVHIGQGRSIGEGVQVRACQNRWLCGSHRKPS